MVNTASAFLSSLHYGRHKPFVSQAIVQILPWVLGHLGQLPSLDDDPELTQSCIELVQKAMIRRPDVFMSQSSESLEFIFSLALNLLNGNEPLPKAAAAEFWVSHDQRRPPLSCPGANITSISSPMYNEGDHRY